MTFLRDSPVLIAGVRLLVVPKQRKTNANPQAL